MVTDSGNAVICDFGISKLVESLTSGRVASSVTGYGAARYCAPEFFTHSLDKPTPSGDVWMFGMTFLVRPSFSIASSLYYAYPKSLAEGVMVWSDTLFIILRGRSDPHAFQPKATGCQRNNCQTF